MSFLRRLTGRNDTPTRRFDGERRAVPMLLALEPRYMFDAAGAATAAETLNDPPPPDDAAHDGATADSAALAAAAAAVVEPVAELQTPGCQEIRAADPAANQGKKEVVFIESDIAGYQTLIDGVKPGVEVMVLDADGDGLAQMAAWAQSHSGYDAVHIVSHGAEGRIDLGALTLDVDAALSRSADLATLGAALTESGDLLLYGCSVASGRGEGFIAVMAAQTGADAAASDDLTGAAALGGDWALERSVGAIETVEITAASFGGVLTNTYTVTVGDNTSDNLTAGADLAADQSDGGGLSLWEALHYAADGDTVAFNLSSGTSVAMNSQSMAVNAGVIFDADSMASLTISDGTLSLAGGLTVTNGTNDNLTISSVIANGTGTGALTKSGDGRLTLSAANTYTGTSSITGGSLVISADNNLGSGALTLNGGQLTLTSFSGPLDNALTLGSSGGTINVSSSAATISGLVSGSGALIKTGGQNLTLSNSGNSAAAATLEVQAGAVIVATDAALIGGAVTLNGGGLAITGAVTIDNNFTLVGSSNTITDGGGATLSGIISGSGGFTKAGGQLLTLSGANTYTGTTAVSAGPMLINHATALGTAAGETVVSSGATLRVGAGLTVAENFTISGGGYSSYGAIKVNGGDATITGDITLAANADLGAYNASDTLTVSGVISGAFNLGKVLDGTVVLSGANTYTGSTTVSVGKLVAANAAALGTVGSGTTVTSGAALGFKDGVTVAEAVTAAGTGASSSGAIYNVSGTNTLSGTVTLTAATTFGVASGGLTVSGVIGGSFGLTKNGAETLTLSGANTYTGSTTVSAGTLIAANDAALGSAATGITVSAGAALGFKDGVTIAEAVTAAGTGVSSSGAIYNVSGTNTLSGAVTLTAATTFGVASGGLTVSGVIGGSFGLTKNGAGTLTLSGASTYTGETEVAAGTLSVTGALGGTSTLSVQDGATLGGTGSIFAASSTNMLTVLDDGTLAPGVAGINNGVGKLTVNGDLRLSGGFAVDIAGSGGVAGTDYDQVAVNGGVQLNGGALTISRAAGHSTAGYAYTLIDNDGADAVAGGAGAFADAAEGVYFTSGGYSYAVSYVGGGNDVVLNDNAAPTFASTAVTAAVSGEAYRYVIVTNDAESDAVTVTATTLPGWLTLVGGVLSGTPGTAEIGTHNVVLTATDAIGNATTQSFAITVSAAPATPVTPVTPVTPANGAPVFTSSPTTAASEDAAYAYAVATTDPNGDAVTVTTSSLPSWLTFANGVLSGTPTQANVGTHTVTLIATDPSGAQTSQSFAIVVTAVDDSPVFTTTPPAVAVTGAAYVYAPAASDEEGQSVTYAAPALPSWLTFSGGVLSGTPGTAEIGAHTVVLTATDSVGNTTTQSFIISVSAAANSAPIFTSTPATTVNERTAYSYTPSATDDDGQKPAFAATTLPSWLTFSGGVLSGTPGQGDVGSHLVTLTATDAAGAVTTQTFTVTVADVNDPPVFTSGQPSNATAGQAFSFSLSASDPEGGSFSFSAASLPAWLTLTDNGNGSATLSGTPGAANVGAAGLTVLATDSGGAVTAQILNFNVASDATPNINQTSSSAGVSTTSATTATSSSSTMTNTGASTGAGAYSGSGAVSLAPSGGATSGGEGASPSTIRVGGVEGNISSATSIQQNQGLTSAATSTDAGASGDPATFVRNAARGDSTATTTYYGASPYLSLANLGGDGFSGAPPTRLTPATIERGQTTPPSIVQTPPVSAPAPAQEQERGQDPAPAQDQGRDPEREPDQGRNRESDQRQDQGQGQPTDQPRRETRADGGGPTLSGFNAQLAAVQSAFDTHVSHLSAAAQALRSAA